MLKITQCPQLLHLPSIQMSCESDLRCKSYEPKITRSRTRGQKIGQVFLATTLRCKILRLYVQKKNSIFLILYYRNGNFECFLVEKRP